MTENFLLHCHHFADTQSTLLEQVSVIQKTDIKVLPEHRLVEILLYGDNNCNEIANAKYIEWNSKESTTETPSIQLFPTHYYH